MEQPNLSPETQKFLNILRPNNNKGITDFRELLDNLESVKSRSIPEKEWPSFNQASGFGKVFDPKNVKYVVKSKDFTL